MAGEGQNWDCEQEPGPGICSAPLSCPGSGRVREALAGGGIGAEEPEEEREGAGLRSHSSRDRETSHWPERDRQCWFGQEPRVGQGRRGEGRPVGGSQRPQQEVVVLGQKGSDLLGVGLQGEHSGAFPSGCVLQPQRRQPRGHGRPLYGAALGARALPRVGEMGARERRPLARGECGGEELQAPRMAGGGAPRGAPERSSEEGRASGAGVLGGQVCAASVLSPLPSWSGGAEEALAGV